MTFRVTVFPAGDGDCLLLSYGSEEKLRHILIDGGRAAAYPFLKKRLAQIRDAGEELDLLVLSHIDADHIEGALKLANDEELPLAPRHVWYNGYAQMDRIEKFGFKQGDEYSEAIAKRAWPLNEAFDGACATIEARPDAFEFAGLTITLLSPNVDKLARLRSGWSAWRTAEAAKKAAVEHKREAGVQTMGREEMPAILDVETLCKPTPTDTEPPNGSSIAFIAEWGGKRILLAADAHPDLLETSLELLVQRHGSRYPIDLMKVSHHASRGNTTRHLVELLDCRRFLISTDGKRHGHPDPQAIARLLAFAPEGERTIYFNHSTKRTTPWRNADLQKDWEYRTEYGEPDGFLEIDI